MTREEVAKLQAAAAAAQAELERAAEAANNDPTNAEKAAALKAAETKAAAATAAWQQAQAASESKGPNPWGAGLLGIYLALMLFTGVYLLGVLTMAQRPEATVGELRTNCCGKEDEYCPAAEPKPTAAPNPAPETVRDTNVNNAAVNNAANVNRNAANRGNAAVNQRTNATNGQNVNTAANCGICANNDAPARAKPSPAGNSSEETQPPAIPQIVCVAHFNRLPADGYLFLIVLFAGMTGAVTRGIFSFVRHLGVRDFSSSWTGFYLFLPLSGGVVSLLLYFIIRGGFYGSPVGKSLVLNLFAFVALGTLTGLFAEHAMEKLRQVAETLLAKVPPKVDPAQLPPEKK